MGQLGQPRGVVNVGLAPRHIFDVAGIGQHQFELAVGENMPDRLPVDAGGLHDDMRTTFRCKPIGEGYQFLGGCLERLNPGHHLAVPQVTNAGHHRLLVNIETSAMRMQKFHRSSSAPLAWSPDRRNLESVLRGGKPPVATIRGAQGAPGPTVTRADAHQTHTDLYAHDAKTLYTNTLARFIYRGSETPVGDCYETQFRRWWEGRDCSR